jgi:hypothetical protein
MTAFRWFWPHVLCMLIVCRPESSCMCVYNMHAHSSADSFAVGSGVWSVYICHVFIGLFWDPVANIIPRDTSRAWLPNILATKIFAYTVVLFVFLVLALWWPSQKSDWIEIWSVRSGDLGVLHMHKIQVNSPSHYKMCLANGPRQTLTYVALKSRSNQKPGYYVMYPY